MKVEGEEITKRDKKKAKARSRDRKGMGGERRGRREEEEDGGGGREGEHVYAYVLTWVQGRKSASAKFDWTSQRNR